jgi:hypothetical protein
MEDLDYKKKLEDLKNSGQIESDSSDSDNDIKDEIIGPTRKVRYKYFLNLLLYSIYVIYFF